MASEYQHVTVLPSVLVSLTCQLDTSHSHLRGKASIEGLLKAEWPVSIPVVDCLHG